MRVYFKRSPSAPVLEFPSLAEKELPGGIICNPPHELGSVPGEEIMVCLPLTMPKADAGLE
ncbi:MAG: hypothetical protein EBS17_02330 [Flavobacteriia bacterium]|nr:hypothetical protein [Flavobacteriia bacterium]